jgi:hypothetical protein
MFVLEWKRKDFQSPALIQAFPEELFGIITWNIKEQAKDEILLT